MVVVDAEGDRLGEFYRIYRETADRAGFLIRTEQAYRDVWEAYRPAGRARLLFAQTADGEPLATLFLVRCGPRVVEPYGGMTQAGAESRANYLLKWEAIRTSREQGATSYDLWGLATGGIAHFKTGFGGREVRYIGAWDLVLDPLGRAVYEGGGSGARLVGAPAPRPGRRRECRPRSGARRTRRVTESVRQRPREATAAELADWDQPDRPGARRPRLPVAGLGGPAARLGLAAAPVALDDDHAALVLRTAVPVRRRRERLRAARPRRRAGETARRRRGPGRGR